MPSHDARTAGSSLPGLTASLPQTRYRAPLLREWLLRGLLPLIVAVLAAAALLVRAVLQVLPTGLQGLGPTLWSAGLLLLAALVIVGVVGWRIASRFQHPISDLTDAVERLGRGEQVRLDAIPGEILGRLQRGVNEASQRLADARNRMHSELGRTTIELADRNARLEAAGPAVDRRR